jgi:FKBP-type peptidyl-prolyl cis-trans isomerase FklB
MSDNSSKDQFSTTEAKASYGVGLQLGQHVKGTFEGVDLETVFIGIRDGYASKPPQVDINEINAAFEEIQKKIDAENAANAGEAAAEGEAFLAENAKRDEITVTASGLQYEIVEAGNGSIPEASHNVRTHYRGTLINGQEFDSSYSRGEPAEFPVNGVIAGWTEALQLMPVGSKWKLYIPQQLAYGAQGAGGAIGPYQALIFDIELLEIL